MLKKDSLIYLFSLQKGVTWVLPLTWSKVLYFCLWLGNPANACSVHQALEQVMWPMHKTLLSIFTRSVHHTGRMHLESLGTSVHILIYLWNKTEMSNKTTAGMPAPPVFRTSRKHELVTKPTKCAKGKHWHILIHSWPVCNCSNVFLN